VLLLSEEGRLTKGATVAEEPREEERVLEAEERETREDFGGFFWGGFTAEFKVLK